MTRIELLRFIKKNNREDLIPLLSLSDKELSIQNII